MYIEIWINKNVLLCYLCIKNNWQVGLTLSLISELRVKPHISGFILGNVQ